MYIRYARRQLWSDLLCLSVPMLVACTSTFHRMFMFIIIGMLLQYPVSQPRRRRCNGLFVWTLLFVVDCHFIAGCCCISNELLNWVDSQIVAPLFLWLWPSTGRRRNPSPQYFYFRRSRPLNEDKIEVTNNNISILEQKNNSSQWATCLWALVILPNDIISLRKIDVIWWSALNAIRM